MTTFSGDVARFNATISGSTDPRTAERLAAHPSALAFSVEARVVPPELDQSATPAYYALLGQVEYRPDGTFFPATAVQPPEVD